MVKDFVKMFLKFVVKFIVFKEDGGLFCWVVFFIGLKNVVKGLGFFFGVVLFVLVGF